MNKHLQNNKRILALLIAFFMGFGTAWATDYANLSLDDFTQMTSSTTAPSGDNYYQCLVVTGFSGGTNQYIFYGFENASGTMLWNYSPHSAYDGFLYYPNGGSSYISVDVSTALTNTTIGETFTFSELQGVTITYSNIGWIIEFPVDVHCTSKQQNANYTLVYWGNLTYDDGEITAEISPEGSGTVSGTGTFVGGNTCTLTATANEGYIFQNWTENGNVVSTDAAYTFTVNGDRNLIANFVYENTGTLTVYDGTATDEGVPIVGWCTLWYTKCEYVMPASDLAAMNGNMITSMTCYNTKSNVSFGAASFKVFMKEVDFTTVAEFQGYEDATIVYEGSLFLSSQGLLQIEFTTPFEYHGGNLLIGVYNCVPGSRVGWCYYYGQSGVGTSIIAWNDESLESISMSAVGLIGASTDDFLPKTTFTYITPSYLIQVASNPTEGGTVSGGGTYEASTECTLTATPNEGFIFQNWTENGEVVSNDAEYSFAVTGDRNLIANFVYESTGTLTVYDGTATDEGVPIVGWCTLWYTKCEYVMPASDLAAMNGNMITSMTCYNTKSNVSFGAASFKVFMKEVDFTTVAEFQGYEDATIVYEGSLFLSSQGLLQIEFTTPFEYHGGNLLIGVYNCVPGSRVGWCYYYGQSGVGTSIIAWNDESLESISMSAVGLIGASTDDFLPKTTFTYITPSYLIQVASNPTEGGTVSGGGTYEASTECTLTAIPNENYTFVNWTKNGTQVSTDATYSFTVTENATYVANFEPINVTQTSNFTSGWNWYSTYIEQEGIDGLAQLEESLGNNGIQIKSQQQYVNYYEGMGWMGMLSSINNESSYKIKTSAACVVEMVGTETTPTAHPIAIGPGWNWIGYPVNSSMSVATAFSNITPTNGDQVKAQNGYANYYEGMGWMGTLSTIEPGMGLLYKSNGSGSQTLVYPTSSKGGTLVENVTPENNHWVPDLHAYPDNMTVTAVVELDDNELQSDSYELAAFANGECRGSVRLMYVAPLNRYVAFLLISGNEAAELSFGLYDTETGMTTFDTDNALTYTTDATVGAVDEPYIVNFRGATGVDEWANSLQVFPNPVSRGANVSLGMTEDTSGEVQVEIVNALGAVLSVETSTKLPSSIKAPEVSGVYTLRITLKGKGTCHRKLVVR